MLDVTFIVEVRAECLGDQVLDVAGGDDVFAVHLVLLVHFC